MPIDLEQLSKASQAGASYSVLGTAKTYSPKFFSQKLTGVGKQRGILCAAANPGMLSGNKIPTTQENIYTRKTSYVNGQTTVTSVPFYVIDPTGWQSMDVFRPDDSWLTAKLAERSQKTINTEIFIHMVPHSIILEETTNTAPASQNGGVAVTSSSRKMTTCYQMFFFRRVDLKDDKYAHTSSGRDLFEPAGSQTVGVTNPMLSPNGLRNGYYTMFTCQPVSELQQYAALLSGLGYSVNGQVQVDFIQNYDLYTGVSKRSEEWQTTIDKTLDSYFENIQSAYTNSSLTMNHLAMTLRYLENYSIPLDLYRTIYQNIKSRFTSDVATILCKQNLNLLLSDQLNDLNTNKANLTHFTPGNPAQSPVNSSGLPKFSKEQQNAIESQEPLVIVQSGAGCGKALPLTTPVLTPYGWKPMGDLQVGDMVIGANGKPTQVLHIYEQGLKDGYHLTFRDGSSIDTCGEHLWTICRRRGDKEYRTNITTEQWVKERKYRAYGYLPTVKPVEYSYGEKDLPLDPYFLGALLADGCFCQSSIQYTKSETAVAEETRKAAARDGFVMLDRTCTTATAKQWRFQHPDDNAHRSELKERLKAIGLTGLSSHEKFIPDIYKTASVTQRIALLNGLFDGDGDVRNNRTYARFNTASEQLSEDVLQLLWSLGLSATRQIHHDKRGDYYAVNLMSDFDPFVASEYKGKASGSVRPIRRSLVDAKPIKAVPMRCIEVDAADQLYVTKDFLVTHNSSVILGRIDYMIANGVSPEDITVLSFTNAAADHIKEKNPRIHSMTIASMIHSIYTLNYPTHELSSTETIANALDIYYQNDPLVKKFQQHVKALHKQDNNAYTAMNNFIEAYLPQVLSILDRIKQTSLELEIILCYQLIDQLKEPPEVQSKFLIIDEVQDNSIFEFIYAIKYVAKHQESLFIVGKLRLPTLNPTNCGKPTRMLTCA